jgi:ABC-type oligopeptide transport system substrate-binding subunit
LFASDERPTDDGANYSRYARRDVDRLLRRAAGTGDDQRRVELFRNAEDRILDRDMAAIPVAVLRRRTVVSDRIRGLVHGPLGAVDLAGVRVVERNPEE